LRGVTEDLVDIEIAGKLDLLRIDDREWRRGVGRIARDARAGDDDFLLLLRRFLLVLGQRVSAGSSRKCGEQEIGNVRMASKARPT
jgi:hypothetical protein